MRKWPHRYWNKEDFHFNRMRGDFWEFPLISDDGGFVGGEW